MQAKGSMKYLIVLTLTALILSVPSDDPLHFRWRVYLPADYEGAWRTSDAWGGDNYSSTGSAENFIAQVRFRKMVDQVFCQAPQDPLDKETKEAVTAPATSATKDAGGLDI
jgi:hypothetical protein